MLALPEQAGLFNPKSGPRVNLRLRAGGANMAIFQNFTCIWAMSSLLATLFSSQAERISSGPVPMVQNFCHIPQQLGGRHRFFQECRGFAAEVFFKFRDPERQPHRLVDVGQENTLGF